MATGKMSSACLGASSPRYGFSDLILDIGQRRLTRNGEPVPLSRLSFEFLRKLVEAAPNLVDHDTLAREVWGPSRIVTPENLSKRVMLLRQALGDHVDEPRYFEGLRGQAYRLVVPVVRLPSDESAWVASAPRPGKEDTAVIRPASSAQPGV